MLDATSNGHVYLPSALAAALAAAAMVAGQRTA